MRRKLVEWHKAGMRFLLSVLDLTIGPAVVNLVFTSRSMLGRCWRIRVFDNE